ncbi:MAG: hypothetical protein ABSC25_24790 [Roseiarcus sp.]
MLDDFRVRSSAFAIADDDDGRRCLTKANRALIGFGGDVAIGETLPVEHRLPEFGIPLLPQVERARADAEIVGEFRVGRSQKALPQRKRAMEIAAKRDGRIAAFAIARRRCVAGDQRRPRLALRADRSPCGFRFSRGHARRSIDSVW